MGSHIDGTWVHPHLWEPVSPQIGFLTVDEVNPAVLNLNRAASKFLDKLVGDCSHVPICLKERPNRTIYKRPNWAVLKPLRAVGEDYFTNQRLREPVGQYDAAALTVVRNL